MYLPFTSIDDSEVSVTDEELKSYLNKNKAKFKQDESRSIQYVSFDILPTKDDTARALKKINESLESFKTTENDSLFIKLYSDSPFEHR